MAEPLRSFDVVLDPEGEGGHFRYQNAPGEVQRRHLVDRGHSLVVQGELVEVVHGKLFADGDDGTLIIAEFHFLPSKNSRRFKYAEIRLRFEAGDTSASEVEVLSIEPLGHHSLPPTTKLVELTKSVNANVTGGTIVQASAGLGWERKESQEKTRQTTITGTIRLEGRSFGGKNTARWTISENPNDNDGIPTLIRTVTLLRRKLKKEKGNFRFQAEVAISCKVDFASTLGEGRDRVFGRIPKDDPVIFDPGTASAQSTIDASELAKQNLFAHSAVVTSTLLSNTIKGSPASSSETLI
ncbi:hypothetical protein BDV96DRAFT_601177 [Lophiotrema nucula]|uniref:Uncharacterized protein n=1 Tax=Lophiotrema nucula TaxID=690887 RepID=A0A6A5Z2K7_9PLEO|nr:hypothetical protein BDV96DRAFT_601177 [Lophiotrema nucula]